MKSLKSLLLTAVLFLPYYACAQTRADDVIHKAVAAMGGIERIHAIHSIVFKGFHFEGSYKQEYAGSKTSNATLIRMRPGMRMVGCRPEIPECNGQWSRIVETFDGQRGWELNWPKQRLVHTVNKADQALRCGAEFDFLFIDYRLRGFHAAYLGRKTVLGTEAEALQIDQQGCSSAVYFFDPKTYRLLMTELTIPIHARGDFIPTVAVYKEFKVVNGVRIPSRSEEVNLNTGDVIGGGEWTSIEINTLHDPTIFAAPVTHPTGITAIVLDMLAKANTASAQEMMAIYSQFRTTDDGRKADVVYDMNWLGFELLKVDKYDYAVDVFQQVITENPALASAYDSLGEAYLQASDKVHAIEAFQRAVNLGLKDEGVSRKLERLRQGS